MLLVAYEHISRSRLCNRLNTETFNHNPQWNAAIFEIVRVFDHILLT